MLVPVTVAVMVTDPDLSAFTVAVVDGDPAGTVTVALELSLDVHVTEAPLIVLPRLSFTTAVSVEVAPTLIVSDVGVTAMLAGAPAFTVTDAVPLAEPLVAVIVVVPGMRPVTTPNVETLATSGLLELQVTGRPPSTLPLASITTAVSVPVCATLSDSVPGFTVTLAAGTMVTVTLVVPLLPPLDAVIVAVPTSTPVTTPAAETVATAGLPEDHVTDGLTTALPFTSVTVAASGTVAPTDTLGDCGATVTLATGGAMIVMAAVALLVPLAAVIVAEPTLTPVTRPVTETVATAGLLEVQVSAALLTTLLLASITVAVSCCV